MEVIKQIFGDKMSDYKIVDIMLKIWVAGLLSMVVLGLVAVISHIIMKQSSIDNATFGVFDTLGN